MNIVNFYDKMNNIEKKELEKYLILISEYVSGRINSIEFETKYLQTYPNDAFHYSEKTYELLATLSSDVDAYCSNPDIRDDNDLDEEQLRQKATYTLCELIINIQAL